MYLQTAPAPVPGPTLFGGLPLEIWLTIASIVAIILGPILAVQVQEFLERGREERRRKLWVFRELMLTRGTVLSPRHVEALNGIQMEFSDKRSDEKKVLDAWKLYLDHLNLQNPPDMNVWTAAALNLLVDLLYEIATCLRYTHFNKARIKSDAYLPRYIVEVENEQNTLRKAAIEVFAGRESLKVEVHEPPASQLRPIGPVRH